MTRKIVPHTELAARRAAERARRAARRAHLRTIARGTLRGLRIARVTVRYAGVGGTAGAIDIHTDPPNPGALDRILLTIARENPGPGQTRVETLSLRTLLERLATGILAEEFPDWHAHDSSHGTLTWHLPTDRIRLQHTHRRGNTTDIRDF